MNPKTNNYLFHILIPLGSILCFFVSLTILFLSMRSVMEIGGFCAEGGPYEIAVPCPKGTALLTPISILIMVFSLLVYFFNVPGTVPNIFPIFWPAIFLSLGWNFLEFGLNPPGGGKSIAWLFCAIIFFLIAISPLFLLKYKDISTLLHKGGKDKLKIQFPDFSENHSILLVIQILLIPLGIIAGILIYNAVTS